MVVMPNTINVGFRVIARALRTSTRTLRLHGDSMNTGL